MLATELQDSGRKGPKNHGEHNVVHLVIHCVFFVTCSFLHGLKSDLLQMSLH
jgi:hypothetical protein